MSVFPSAIATAERHRRFVILIVSFVFGLFTLGFGLIIIWPICVVWGSIAAHNYNQQFVAPRASQSINN